MTNTPSDSSPTTPTLPGTAWNLGKSLFLTAAWLAAAVGLGLYVYPDRPALVWFLLALCWTCYRLRMRAVARFGKSPGAPSVRR